MPHDHLPPQPGGAFRIQIGDPELNFRTVEIPDPVPTARQILDAAGARPADDYLVIALLPAWHLQRRPLAEAMKAY